MEEMRKLTYESYLTGKASRADELPMIIPLHFMGSSPEQIFDILLNGFNCSTRVVAPYGQYKYAGQYSWFPDSLYDENERNQGRFIDEVTGLLLENVESWTQEFPTRGKPIYLGVSQGGDMCFTLAARYGNRFRLCLPVAGRLLVEEIVQRRNAGAVRIHHGEKDPIVPIARTREAAQQLLSAGIDAELREYVGAGHAVPLEMRKAIFDDIYAVIRERSWRKMLPTDQPPPQI
jgi:predicted esterase